MELFEMDRQGFVIYLKQLAEDYESSGRFGTAEDYREAARRIAEIPHLEQAAYEAGLIDAGAIQK